MKFSDIPAHEYVKEHLRALVDSNRLPHALLLEGPEGVGKFALARALAQYIHCENRTNGDSCGVCPSCRQHETFNHADTIFSFPILKAQSATALSDDFIREWKKFLENNPFMSFEQWLAALNNPNGQPLIYSSESINIIRKFSTTSYSTRFKVMLMWLPERMQPDCANKLLKLIEEPFEDSILVFVTNNSGEILPTIYSRMQRIKVKRLSDDVVANYLMSHNSNISNSDAYAVAHLAEGSILKAEKQLSESSELKQFLTLFISLMRNAYQRKVSALRKWSVDVAALGREGEMRFMDYCERMMRENFINNIHIPELVYLNTDEQAFCRNFSPFINERNVENLLFEFNTAKKDIAANGNAKIIFFDLAIKVILLLK